MDTNINNIKKPSLQPTTTFIIPRLNELKKLESRSIINTEQSVKETQNSTIHFDRYRVKGQAKESSPLNLARIFKKYFHEEKILITMYFDKIVCYKLKENNKNGLEVQNNLDSEIDFVQIYNLNLLEIFAKLSYFLSTIGIGWVVKEYQEHLEDAMFKKSHSRDQYIFSIDVLFKFGIFMKFYLRMPKDQTLSTEELKIRTKIELNTIFYWKPLKPHYSDSFYNINTTQRPSYNLIYPYSRIKHNDESYGHSKYPLIMDNLNKTVLSFVKKSTDLDK